MDKGWMESYAENGEEPPMDPRPRLEGGELRWVREIR